MRLKEKVMHILEGQLRDNVKAHILMPSGEYEKVDKRGKVLYNSQDAFCQEAAAWARQDKEEKSRVFIPETHVEDSHE